MANAGHSCHPDDELLLLYIVLCSIISCEIHPAIGRFVATVDRADPDLDARWCLSRELGAAVDITPPPAMKSSPKVGQPVSSAQLSSRQREARQ